MSVVERDADGLSTSAIALIGIATLLFEILLTRIFSVTMWYHFAFVAISLALFGIAVSGVALTVFHHFFQRFDSHRILGIAAAGFGLAMPAAFLADLHIPFIPFDFEPKPLDLMQIKAFALFFAKFVVLSIPFFFSGLTIALAFARFSTRINRIYFADLTGAGLGCALAVPVLLAMSGPSAVIAAGSLPLIGATLFFLQGSLRRHATIALTSAIALIAIAVVNERLSFIRVERVKSYEWNVAQRRERPKLYERWHPVSRVVVHPPQYSYSPIPWFYSEALPEGIPTNLLEVTNDAGARTFIYPSSAVGQQHIFRGDLSDLVYSMTDRPKMLAIGVGGGKDIVSALAFGARSAAGVELNPLMIDVVQNVFGDFSGRPYNDPRVRIFIDEGRNFIASRNEQYDVIKISVTDTWAASAIGAYALSENYLYTEEAVRDYLTHLTPGGYLSITRWYPTESYRLISLISHALRTYGYGDPASRVLMARNRANMTVIVKKEPFSTAEVARFVDRVDEGQLKIVRAPGFEDRESRASHDVVHRYLLNRADITSLEGQLPFTVTPPTDDRPFFFNFKTGKDPATAHLRQLSRAMSLLRGLAWIAVLMIALFIIGPYLMVRRKSWTRDIPSLGANLYFVALGIGYLLVEVPLLQRLILFLGHPIYSMSVVLFSFLVSSGIGSLLSTHIVDRPRRATAAAALAGLVVAASVPALPPMLNALIGLPIAARIAIAIAVVFPIGFLMGIPFPYGIRRMRTDGRTAWAWALNGAASVAAPILAMIISVGFGFSAALFVGAIAYEVAALLAPTLDTTHALDSTETTLVAESP